MNVPNPFRTCTDPLIGCAGCLGYPFRQGGCLWNDDLEGTIGFTAVKFRLPITYFMTIDLTESCPGVERMVLFLFDLLLRPRLIFQLLLSCLA